MGGGAGLTAALASHDLDNFFNEVQEWLIWLQEAAEAVSER